MDHHGWYLFCNLPDCVVFELSNHNFGPGVGFQNIYAFKSLEIDILGISNGIFCDILPNIN